jgi:hypothetical protein
LFATERFSQSTQVSSVSNEFLSYERLRNVVQQGIL